VVSKAARDLEKQEKAAAKELARQERLKATAAREQARQEKIDAATAWRRHETIVDPSEDEDAAQGVAFLVQGGWEDFAGWSAPSAAAVRNALYIGPMTPVWAP
jgi:hypothetical protein